MDAQKEQPEPPRILVAEDDRVQRLILTQLLKKGGFEVEAVDDGVKALARALQPDSPELVILDWEMPGMTGAEVCREIRASTAVGTRYIVLATAREDAESKIEGLEAGADDFLHKPICGPELQARLGAGLRIAVLQTERELLASDLRHAVAEIRRLQSLLPTCPHCGAARDEAECARRTAVYLKARAHAGANFECDCDGQRGIRPAPGATAPRGRARSRKAA